MIPKIAVLFMFFVQSAFGNYHPVVKVQHDIQYGEAFNDRNEHLRLFMDMYHVPAGDKSKKPVIVLVHGGGFGRGDKQQKLYVEMAETFAGKGFVAFSINYRLNTGSKPDSTDLMNSVNDLLTAIHWIKNHHVAYGIDTTGIIVAGDSAGGAIVVNAAYHPEGKDMIAGCINLWGGLPFSHSYPEINRYGQPVNYNPLTGKNPPTCIIHGDHDRIIPVATGLQLAEELKAAGVEYEIHILEGADHYPEKLADKFIPMMIVFAFKIVGKWI